MLKLLISVLLLNCSAYADSKNDKNPTQLRLFVGEQNASPTDVNTVLTSGGLKNYKDITTYGVEATYAIIPHVNLGARGEGKWQKVLETAATSANPSNPYYSSVQQTAAMAVLRVDVVTTSAVMLDVFGAAGTAKTSMDIRTASGDGNYSSSNSFISSAGASLAIGWDSIFFLVEVGHEWNKIGGLSKNGVTSSSINSIDLSGSYATIGLLFNGLPSWIHKK